MKTTVEIPDPLFRRVKSAAAAHGQSLRGFLTAALAEKLSARAGRKGDAAGWRSVFGKAPPAAVRQVESLLAQEFSRVDPLDWK